MTPTDPTEPPGRNSGQLLAADLDTLFDAAMSRLQTLTTTGADPHGGSASQMHECMAALAQLHRLQVQERGLHQRTERDLRLALGRLAQTRTELVASQAAEMLSHHSAQHDALTALPNRDGLRRRLADRLAPSAQPAPPLALLYLDLDGFKSINDQHGHDAGDTVLRIVATRLRKAMRAEDVVGRLGGDEFVCLLSDPTGRDKLGRLAGQLCEVVSAPLHLGMSQVSVRPSIGIACLPEDGVTADALLIRADAAMYRAKRSRAGFAFSDRAADGR